MATIEELSAALIKADAAGNAADAKVLADAIRQMRGAPVTAATQEMPLGQRIIQTVRPTVETLGAVGGGMVGMGLGPPGAVGGAGLGYGIAKTGLDVLEQQLGYQAPPATAGEALARGAEDVLTGTTFEAGGRVVGQGLGWVGGKLADIRQKPLQRAAQLAKGTLGTFGAAKSDLPLVLNALRNAPPGATVAEATAGIESPAWQALIKRSLERLPESQTFINRLRTASDREALNALSMLAGGTTATDIRAAAETGQRAARAITTPMRESALSRADLGKQVARLEGTAAELGEQAATKVEDVRRLTRLAAQAEVSAATTPVRTPSGERIGMPMMPGRYSYAADLAKKADGWATQAAQGSLDAGLAAREAKGATDALRNVGIEPLDANRIIMRMRSAIRDPQLAGIREIEKAIDNFSVDVKKWTDVDGIIPAGALDALRKNSVSSTINELMPSASDQAKKAAAVKVLTQVRPIIDDAIEAAGGVGYKEYLAKHAELMQNLAQKKLTGEALRLWKTNPDEFVRLVQNESPEAVEKILGSGKYNIATELADSTLDVLRQQAQRHLSREAAKRQASEGTRALATVYEQQSHRLRFPTGLKTLATITEKGLVELENRVGAKTMRVLSEAMTDPAKAANLLEVLPAKERIRVLKILSEPTRFAPGRTAVSVAIPTMINSLAPEPENALVQ